MIPLIYISGKNSDSFSAVYCFTKLCNYPIWSACTMDANWQMASVRSWLEGTRWRSCLIHCATSRKVAGSIP